MDDFDRVEELVMALPFDHVEERDMARPHASKKASGMLRGTRQKQASASSRTACEILAEALAGDARVDFPLVTEICERTRSDSLELAMLTCLLASVLGDSGEDLSRQLKAVTVAHELLYDESARRSLAAAPGLVDSLRYLKVAASAIGGSPAAEGVYLLSSETLRQLTVPANPLDRSSSSLNEDRGWFGAIEDFLSDIPIA